MAAVPVGHHAVCPRRAKAVARGAARRPISLVLRAVLLAPELVGDEGRLLALQPLGAQCTCTLTCCERLST